VAVYFGLSALDFPFCFLAVRLIGTEKIAEAEAWIVDGFWSLMDNVGLDRRQKEAVPTGGVEGVVDTVENGEKQGQHHDASTFTAPGNETEANNTDICGSAGIWTQLILAYGVHKSLIFFRVPLTAMVTPPVVKWLRARGWKIGNPKAK
jgi:N-terminal acetyltransferase 2